MSDSNGNNYNNDEDSTERIESDLARVEQELQRAQTAMTTGSYQQTSWFGISAPVSSSGRATFESIASSLTLLRRRLLHNASVHPDESSNVDNNDRNNATAAATAAAGTEQQHSNRSLMARLETAELSHSSRIPLHLLQQEMERRRASANSIVVAEKEEERGEDGKPNNDRDEVMADKNDKEEEDSGNGVSRRRASTLMASRSRDEALQRQAQDRELHSMGAIEVILTLPSVDEAEEQVKSGSMALSTSETTTDLNDGASLLGRVKIGEDKLMEDNIVLKEDDSGNWATVLLTDKSCSRLAHSSSAILLARNTTPASSNSSGAASEPAAPVSNSVVYSWGQGFHSLHDTDTPRSLANAKISTEARVSRNTIMQVGVGPGHVAAVTTTGQLLVCGNNAHGQVDPQRKDETMIARPALQEFLSNSMTRILQVSCGQGHTAAVTGGGTVLTWGDNKFGQLGHRKKSGSIPSAMVGVTRAAQVSCGYEYTAVLTRVMHLYICGSQDVVTWNGGGGGNELDDGKKDPEPPLPQTIPTLEGLPLVKVAAGARHVVVVTAAGTAFTWGSNEEGCCSRAIPKSIHTPVPIIFATDNMDVDQSDEPRQQLTSDENPLQDFSPFPHWSRANPKEPVELDPKMAIADAACGEAFSLFVTKTGVVYVCGCNGQGQLGLPGQPSVLPATKLYTITEKVKSLAAGQCHSLLLDHRENVWSMGNGQETPELCLQSKVVQAIYAGGKESVAIALAPARTIAHMEREFSLQKSSDDEIEALSENTVERLIAQDDKGCLIKRVREFFASPSVWNSLFWDPAECDDLYQKLLTSPDKETTIAIARAIEQGMQQGLEQLRDRARLLYPEAVRFLLLFLQCPLWINPSIAVEEGNRRYEFDPLGDLALALCETFLNLPFEGYKAIQQWATAAYGTQYFTKYLVKPLVSILDRALAGGAGAKSRPVPGIVTLLRWFHGTAQRHPSLAAPQDFHSHAIGRMEPEVLYEDLKRWKKDGKRTGGVGGFCLSANPFLLSPSTKRTLLMIENQVEMLRAATSNLTWDRDHHQFVFDPFFVLAIDRANLLPQTLQKISAASHIELRKSLKIVFKGEDAVDAGGVTKEFFHLLGHQLFDFSTGMWSMQFGDNITWFNGDCTWNDDGYYLVGVLTGLAVYNGVLLDVHFPRAVYRKLLGNILGLEDMVDEETKKGLQQLLDYKGDDVEHIFCLSFEHTWMDLGIQRRVELKPGGADVPVTSDNKEEYVMLYVKWILVDSVKAQYEAFERGVMQVLESSSLDLLQPEELELLLVGTPDLDLDAWEKNTSYEGFEADSPVIVNFWKFVRQSDRETQLKLLKFTTGTSRAPIGGLGAMPFKIQRAGADSTQLPTSHTCFNILILPDYGENYEKLEHLLGRAILECEGFGLQ